MYFSIKSPKIDLDDISQPENGAHLSGADVDMSDTESECSAKEEEIEDDPPETHYILNEEEEFGGVCLINCILEIVCKPQVSAISTSVVNY